MPQKERKGRRQRNPFCLGRSPMKKSKIIQNVAQEQQSQADPMEAPSQEDIARLAYDIYTRKGYEEGRHEDHWHEAEQTLRGGLS